MKNLAIFASGSGTNAEQLIRYFQHHPNLKVACIYCNKPQAGVLERAKNLNIEAITFSKDEFKEPKFLASLKAKDIHGIILAGFLWKVPNYLTDQYHNLIINIHPALLPKYGGKGMYGHHVHETVINNKEKKSGITIHLVNEKYDDGQILYQASCDVLPRDTPESLANKIHRLEHAHFPRVADDYFSETLLKE